MKSITQPSFNRASRTSVLTLVTIVTLALLLFEYMNIIHIDMYLLLGAIFIGYMLFYGDVILFHLCLSIGNLIFKFIAKLRQLFQ